MLYPLFHFKFAVMRAEELTEEATNMFREYLRNLEENTKFDILREMKAVMDISFGEKNNQIVRPDVVDIARLVCFPDMARRAALMWSS